MVDFLLNAVEKKISRPQVLETLLFLWEVFPKKNLCRDAVIFLLQKEEDMSNIETYWNNLQNLFGPEDFYTFLANKAAYSRSRFVFERNNFVLTPNTLLSISRLLMDDVVLDAGIPQTTAVNELKKRLEIYEAELPGICVAGNSFPDYPQDLKYFIVELVAYRMRNLAGNVASIWLDVIALLHFDAFDLQDLRWKRLLHSLEKKEVIFHDELKSFRKDIFPKFYSDFLTHLKQMFQMVKVSTLNNMEACELEGIVCSYGFTLSEIWGGDSQYFQQKALVGKEQATKAEDPKATETDLKTLLGME